MFSNKAGNYSMKYTPALDPITEETVSVSNLEVLLPRRNSIFYSSSRAINGGEEEEEGRPPRAIRWRRVIAIVIILLIALALIALFAYYLYGAIEEIEGDRARKNSKLGIGNDQSDTYTLATRTTLLSSYTASVVEAPGITNSREVRIPSSEVAATRLAVTEIHQTPVESLSLRSVTSQKWSRITLDTSAGLPLATDGRHETGTTIQNSKLSAAASCQSRMIDSSKARVTALVTATTEPSEHLGSISVTATRSVVETNGHDVGTRIITPVLSQVNTYLPSSAAVTSEGLTKSIVATPAFSQSNEQQPLQTVFSASQSGSLLGRSNGIVTKTILVHQGTTVGKTAFSHLIQTQTSNREEKPSVVSYSSPRQSYLLHSQEANRSSNDTSLYPVLSTSQIQKNAIRSSLFNGTLNRPSMSQLQRSTLSSRKDADALGTSVSPQTPRGSSIGPLLSVVASSRSRSTISPRNDVLETIVSTLLSHRPSAGPLLPTVTSSMTRSTIRPRSDTDVLGASVFSLSSHRSSAWPLLSTVASVRTLSTISSKIDGDELGAGFSSLSSHRSSAGPLQSTVASPLARSTISSRNDVDVLGASFSSLPSSHRSSDVPLLSTVASARTSVVYSTAGNTTSRRRIADTLSPTQTALHTSGSPGTEIINDIKSSVKNSLRLSEIVTPSFHYVQQVSSNGTEKLIQQTSSFSNSLVFSKISSSKEMVLNETQTQLISGATTVSPSSLHYPPRPKQSSTDATRIRPTGIATKMFSITDGSYIHSYNSDDHRAVTSQESGWVSSKEDMSDRNASRVDKRNIYTTMETKVPNFTSHQLLSFTTTPNIGKLEPSSLYSLQTYSALGTSKTGVLSTASTGKLLLTSTPNSFVSKTPLVSLEAISGSISKWMSYTTTRLDVTRMPQRINKSSDDTESRTIDEGRETHAASKGTTWSLENKLSRSKSANINTSHVANIPSSLSVFQTATTENPSSISDLITTKVSVTDNAYEIQSTVSVVSHTSAYIKGGHVNVSWSLARAATHNTSYATHSFSSQTLLQQKASTEVSQTLIKENRPSVHNLISSTTSSVLYAANQSLLSPTNTLAQSSFGNMSIGTHDFTLLTSNHNHNSGATFPVPLSSKINESTSTLDVEISKEGNVTLSTTSPLTNIPSIQTSLHKTTMLLGKSQGSHFSDVETTVGYHSHSQISLLSHARETVSLKSPISTLPTLASDATIASSRPASMSPTLVDSGQAAILTRTSPSSSLTDTSDQIFKSSEVLGELTSSKMFVSSPSGLLSTDPPSSALGMSVFVFTVNSSTISSIASHHASLVSPTAPAVFSVDVSLNPQTTTAPTYTRYDGSVTLTNVEFHPNLTNPDGGMYKSLASEIEGVIGGIYSDNNIATQVVKVDSFKQGSVIVFFHVHLDSNVASNFSVEQLANLLRNANASRWRGYKTDDVRVVERTAQPQSGKRESRDDGPDAVLIAVVLGVIFAVILCCVISYLLCSHKKRLPRGKVQPVSADEIGEDVEIQEIQHRKQLNSWITETKSDISGRSSADEGIVDTVETSVNHYASSRASSHVESRENLDSYPNASSRASSHVEYRENLDSNPTLTTNLSPRGCSRSESVNNVLVEESVIEATDASAFYQEVDINYMFNAVDGFVPFGALHTETETNEMEEQRTQPQAHRTKGDKGGLIDVTDYQSARPSDAHQAWLDEVSPSATANRTQRQYEDEDEEEEQIARKAKIERLRNKLRHREILRQESIKSNR